MADGSGTPNSSVDLRSSALAEDARSSASASIALLWSELAGGYAVAVDRFCTDERLYVVVRTLTRNEPRRPGLTRRNVMLLQRALAGDALKVTAYDLGLSQSSLSFQGARCLHAMGFPCSPSRVPAILVFAAVAALAESSAPNAQVASFRQEVVEHRVYSVPRPDPAAIATLSNAERAVVKLLIERRTNAEIASLRATSVRTVANQVNSVLHKLRAGSRIGLLARLVVGDGLASASLVGSG